MLLLFSKYNVLQPRSRGRPLAPTQANSKAQWALLTSGPSPRSPQLTLAPWCGTTPELLPPGAPKTRPACVTRSRPQKTAGTSLVRAPWLALGDWRATALGSPLHNTRPWAMGTYNQEAHPTHALNRHLRPRWRAQVFSSPFAAPSFDMSLLYRWSSLHVPLYEINLSGFAFTFSSSSELGTAHELHRQQSRYSFFLLSPNYVQIRCEMRDAGLMSGTSETSAGFQPCT